MRFNEYWQRLVAAKPGLADENRQVILTVAQFRRQLQQAVEMCWPDAPTEDGSLFDRLFGIFK